MLKPRLIDLCWHRFRRHLPAHIKDLDIDELRPIVLLTTDLATLQLLLEDPAAFFEQIFQSGGPALKALLIAKVRVKLEPKLVEVMDIARVSGPQPRKKRAAIVSIQAHARGSLGRRQADAQRHSQQAMAPTKTGRKSTAEPVGVKWEEIVPVLQSVDSLAALEQALDDPMAFIEQLLKANGPAASRLVVAGLRYKLEPTLTAQGLMWADVSPALEAIDTLDELRAVAEDPTTFLEQLAVSGAAGRLIKKLCIAKLRPRLEPKLP